MAKSGVIQNDFRKGYRVQISWDERGQDIANNTSTIEVRAQLVSTGSSYTINASATKYGSLTVNGSVYNFTFNASLSGNQTKTVYTKTVVIPHNSDGTKNVSLATTLGIEVTLSGTFYGNVSTSGNGSLDTIPRTSSFSISEQNMTIGHTTQNIAIHRASDAFTHKVYYRFGSINALIDGAATTSSSFKAAIGDCSQIPNATTGIATIVVETYSGGTFIGSNQLNVTMVVPSEVKPTIASLGAELVPSGAPADMGYVKGKSKCKLTINSPGGSYGSTIRNYNISGGGFSSTASSFTTGDLTSAGNITFTAYVTDSRGRNSDSKSVTINVKDYTNPNITGFVAFRCNASGAPTDDGTYVAVKPVYNWNTVGGLNTLTTKAEHKITTSTTWTNDGPIVSGATKVIGGINADNTYNVKFTITDKFISISREVIISTAYVTMDVKKGGKGIAFGKSAEIDNQVDIAMDIRMRKNIIAEGGTYCHHATAGGGDGSKLYLKVMTFTITQNYKNQPMYFKVCQRGRSTQVDLHVMFQSVANTDPSLQSFGHSGGDIDAYMYKKSPGVWDLYIKKTESYDVIDITDYRVGPYMVDVQRIWQNEVFASVPSGHTKSVRLDVGSNNPHFTDRININAHGGQCILGVGTEDIFLFNSKSNKYFNLKNSGSMFYSGGPFVLNQGGEAMRLQSGSNGGHTYIGFYPNGVSDGNKGTRFGYLGYGGNGTTTLTVRAENGNLDLSSGHTVLSQGHEVLSRGNHPGPTRLWSGNLNTNTSIRLTGAAKFNYLGIYGKPGSASAPIGTVFMKPMYNTTSGDNYRQLTTEVSYIKFAIYINGNDVIIARNAGSGGINFVDGGY